MVGLLGAIGYAAPGFMAGREWADKQRLTQADLEGVEALGQAFRNWGLGGGMSRTGAPDYYRGATPYPGEPSEPMYRPRSDIPAATTPGWQAGLSTGGGQDASVGEGMARWGVGGAMSTPAGMPTRSPANPAAGAPQAPELNLTGGGRWLPGAGGPGSGPDARLAFERQGAAAQLLQDPAALERLYRTVSAEDPRGLVPQIEEILNRGAARGQDVRTASNDPNFYPQRTQQYRGGDVPRAEFDKALRTVLGGSNVTQYATDNASQDVGLGWGQRAADPYTLRTASGERYGPARRDMPWVLERTGGAMPRAAEGSAPYPGQVPGGSGGGGGGGPAPGGGSYQSRVVTTDPRSGLPQMDVPSLAQRIMQANPNISGAGMWAALNRAIPLLNADGKIQLAEMRSMDAQDRLRFLYSKEGRLYEQFERTEALKREKMENADKLARDLSAARTDRAELTQDRIAAWKSLDRESREKIAADRGQNVLDAIDKKVAAADKLLTKKQEFEEETGGNVKTMMLRKYRREFEAREGRRPTPEEEMTFINSGERPSATEVRTAREDARFQGGIDLIHDVLDDIHSSYRPGGVNPVGAAGAAMRLGEIGSNIMGWSDENSANLFQSKVEALRAVIPSLLTGRAVSGKDERERMTRIVRGLEMGDTRQITKGDLEWLAGFLQNQRPGTVQGRPSPLVKPEDWEAKFRRDAKAAGYKDSEIEAAVAAERKKRSQ